MSLASCGGSADSYIKKGNEFFKAGAYSEAEINYRKAIQKDPASGEAYYRLATAELSQSRPQDAYQSFLESLRLDPKHALARSEFTNLALPAYIVDTSHPKAVYDVLIRLSNQWLAENPNSLEGLRIKAYLAMLERRPEEAIALFQRALVAHPKDLKMTLGVMDALFRNDQGDEAARVGQSYLKADPSAGEIYDTLYRIYQMQGKAAEAEEMLVRKANTVPENGDSWLVLAGHYARNRKKPEMEAALTSFFKASSKDPKSHLHGGDFFVTIGDWQRASEQFQTGIQTDPSNALIYQDRLARTLIQQGKKEEALKVLNVTVGKNPEDREARTLRGALVVSQGKDRKTGVTELKALVDKDPRDFFLRYVYAKALIDAGDSDTARLQLLEVVKANPQYLDAQIELAKVVYQQGNLAQAAQYSGTALQTDPNNYAAQLIRGSSLRRMGNLEEAAAILEHLLRQAPTSLEAKVELAYIDLSRRRFPVAEAAFLKLRRENPNDILSLGGLIDTDLAQNRPENAFGRLDQELLRTHGAPMIHRMYANVAMTTGKLNVAIEHLQKLADLSPKASEPLLDLANVYRVKGDLRNAIEALNKAALVQPADPRPGQLLPFLLETDHRSQDAKQIARRALARHPDDPDDMNNLAFLLAETGDSLDEALKLALAAVAKVPNQPSFKDTLGYVYLRREQNEEALAIFSQLKKKYPADPTCGYHLGMALYQSGDHTRARVELSQALRNRPPQDIEVGINDLLKRL